MRLILGLFLLGLLLAGAVLLSAFDVSGQPFDTLRSYSPEKSYYPDDKWYRLADPALAGWSTQRLDEAARYAEEIHSDAVLAVHNGVVIFAYGDCTKRYKLHSVRKSLMNVMYGIFVQKGRVDVQSTLSELGIDDIERLSEDEKRATIRDLLMSMSGVYHPAAYETGGMIEKRPVRGTRAPGEFWYYNNWDFNTLVTIINRETEQDFFEAFQRYLAEPLQMEHFRIEDTEYRYERDKSMHPAYLFKMSAVDLARVGLLYLRDGTWKGQQIVDKTWVADSTSAQHPWKPEEPDKGYGYLWKAVEDGFYAAGVGGQRIIVAPKYDLVVVHQVDTRGKKRVKSKKIWNLYDKIVAARPRGGRDGAT